MTEVLTARLACPSLRQWAEDGRLGLSGQSVMLAVGGAGSDEHAAAPILPLWMEEPSVKAHPSREWPAPHFAQVKMTYSLVLLITSSGKVVEHLTIREFPVRRVRMDFRTSRTLNAGKTRMLILKTLNAKNFLLFPNEDSITFAHVAALISTWKVNQEHLIGVIWFTVTHHFPTYCLNLDSNVILKTYRQMHLANSKMRPFQPLHAHGATLFSHARFPPPDVFKVLRRWFAGTWLPSLLSHSSGRRLDRLGKVVRLWDRVHPLAQSRVPGPPAQKRREALQRQHDGEQKLHRGVVCTQ